MTTIAVDTAPDGSPDPLDADPDETARRFRQAARGLRRRARRIRRRVGDIDDSLQPFQVAMRRRACELELTATALAALADGFGDRTDTQAAPR